MLTTSTIEEYRAWRRKLNVADGRVVGFFPTMGALHEGHLDLARAARTQCAVVVSSIFVNPAQFAAHEDFGSYPRQHEEDLRKLREAGVDMVFLPTKELMYPDGYDTYVACDVGSGRNEGAVRPHFFRGVATVCTKLFNIVRPDVVFFGQKDAQQCVVIEHLCRDLNMGIHVVIVPTHREQDGLAMSSRNAYLSEDERRRAPIVYRSLEAARLLVEEKGEKSAAAVSQEMRRVLAEDEGLQVQYTQVLQRETLEDLTEIPADGEALLAVATVLGKTRLIDNMIVRGLR